MVAVCGRCAGARGTNVGACPFCGSNEPMSDPAPGPSVHEAMRRWGATVFGAPKALDRLVSKIDVRDEVLERLVTQVYRRDFREERAPSAAHGTTVPRQSVNALDPFELSPAAVRAETEHVTTCSYCGGAGKGPCRGCAGSGRRPCGGCGGTGKEAKHYKNGNTRYINCKICRATGSLSCQGCGGGGTIRCDVCTGGGYQLAWYAYYETERWDVRVEPDSPVLLAHRQLKEARAVSRDDLTAFNVLAMHEHKGPLAAAGYRDVPAPLVGAARVEPRLERIGYQQYVKMSVVRRDVTYEMAGTSGTVVLSGNDLRGADQPRALAPIRRRQYLWAAGTFGVGALGYTLSSSFRGKSAYFAGSSSLFGLLILATMAAAAPAIGGVLRAWRPGFKKGKVATPEFASAVVAALFFLVTGIGAALSRPSFGEVERALAKGDAKQARLVVDALKETKPGSADLAKSEDAVLFAEAQAAIKAEERLQRLDAVAARGGANAAKAKDMARVERLGAIRSQLDSKAGKKALDEIERLFGDTSAKDVEVAELSAKAHELVAEGCKDPGCQLVALSAAQQRAPSAQREARVTTARSDLLSLLNAKAAAGETTAARVDRLERMANAAGAALTMASADPALKNLATETMTKAAAERAKTPLLGSEAAAIESLLGVKLSEEGPFPSAVVDGTSVYFVFDAAKRCKGIYAVGAKPKSRAMKGGTWSPDRLLSQAVGRDVKVKAPQGGTSAKWFEAPVQVVARWNGGAVMEMRVGDVGM